MKSKSKSLTAAQARPLSKLAPMIRKELKAGFQAGERHWKKAGRLLNEARQHFTTKGFPKNGKGPTWGEWVAKEFTHPMTNEPLQIRTAQRWMQGEKNGRQTGAHSVLQHITDRRSPQHKDHQPKLDWQSNVRKVQRKISPRLLEKQWEDEKQEIRARAKLAYKIVEAGYRALAAVVHPDKKGGSKEAMAKLSATRKWIDEQIRRNTV